jgi:hypothetical protein
MWHVRLQVVFVCKCLKALHVERSRLECIQFSHTNGMLCPIAMHGKAASTAWLKDCALKAQRIVGRVGPVHGTV